MRRLACRVFTLSLACTGDGASEATDITLGEHVLVAPSAVFASDGCVEKSMQSS